VVPEVLPVVVGLWAQDAPAMNIAAVHAHSVWRHRAISEDRSGLRTGGLQLSAGFEGFAAGRLVEIVVAAGIQNGPG